MAWLCENHYHNCHSVKFYCRAHEISVCRHCAIKEHSQAPCKLNDIRNVISEMKEGLNTTLAEKRSRLQGLYFSTDSCESTVKKHFESLNEEVNTFYDLHRRSVRDRELEAIRLLNKKADETLRFINEKRVTLTEMCRKKVERQHRALIRAHQRVISESFAILQLVNQQIAYCRSAVQEKICALDCLNHTIQQIGDDKTLVTEAPRILSSADKTVQTNFCKDAIDKLHRIQCEVKRVKFVEGKVGGEHYSRIDGHIGKWNLVTELQIPSTVLRPWIRGVISDDEICVSDMKNNDFYVTNMSTGSVTKAIPGDRSMFVTSCASVSDEVIVCGKWRSDSTGDNLDGSVTLYDRNWRVIKNITIPRNTTCVDGEVFVDVDAEGMIIAAEHSQSNIYIINPVDGKIMNTVVMRDKEIRGGLQALQSGDIFVETNANEFTTVSRSGEEKAVIHRDECDWSWCQVDQLTDERYITHRDLETADLYVVNRISASGEVANPRIMEYGKSDGSIYMGPCFITSSGKLIVFDGEKLYVFEKKFAA